MTVVSDDPLAYFITWTVYGTFLQGDDRWWRSRDQAERPPQPKLNQWHRDRLNHEVLLLNKQHQQIVQSAIDEHCRFRTWKQWAANVRSNHVHVVVTANGYSGDRVRDQLKANCTRKLREVEPIFVDRPIWTVRGDWKCLSTERGLESAVTYVIDAQDQKGRD